MRVLLLVLALFCGTAHAADLSIPGLSSDSERYARSLQQQRPAGLPPQARAQAEQRAADAQRRNDWPTAVTALETRLSGSDRTTDLWLQLARAQLRLTPPDAIHAAESAWQAYTLADDGPAQIPALLVMAAAFKVTDRPEPVIQVLEAVLERTPDDAGVKQMLADARRQAGILVRRVRTEPESDPPLACIEFTTAPARRNDLVPADWVRLQPAQPDAAITRQGDAFCIAGLELGATTQVTLRAGLPGEDSITLKRETTLAVTMANRKPRIIFDSRLFLLPRDQPSKLTIATVNLSSVTLKVLRLTERNLVPMSRNITLGQATERYAFDGLTDNGKQVWQGTAAIPTWQPNRIARTALPLPDVFAEPGAYLILATPGDGTPDDDAGATQVIIRTDLAPTVWRGADGLTVQVRSLADANPRAGVTLRLLAHDNEILGQTTTDDQGVARFAAPLLAGTGPETPQNLTADIGTDLVTMDLTTAAFDLSDRGVEGLADPGPLDAYAWTDRGIYRPGETVQLMALLRDASGQPLTVPTHLVIKRPNGQVFLDKVPPPGPDGSVYLPIALSLSSPAGQWSVDILADPKRPPIGHASFRVDAFVPDRMAVDAKPNGQIVPGIQYDLPITARFLYGAPAADLSGSATLKLTRDPNPPAALAGYHVGLEGEAFAPETQSFTLPATDREGKTNLAIVLNAVPDSTFPIHADLDIGVDDPSGHASTTSVQIPVRAVTGFIGIKPSFDDAIDAGAEAGFDVVAVDRDGKRIAMKARLRLVRERPDWHLVMRGSLARYETVYKDESIAAEDVTISASGTLHFARRLDFGRYRIELAESGGLAASSVRFRAGWVASDSPDTPDKVDVSTDRHDYAPGDIAHVHVVAPFAGKATLLALTNKVNSLQTFEIPAAGTTVDVPVDAAWGPGAYLTVHVFRSGTVSSSNGQATRPTRAIGLAWAGLDPALRTLKLTIDAPDKTKPRGRVTIPVHAAPGAYVTLAAVDEGILRLTKFVSPDPIDHFLGRRALGIDIRDDWGRLIPPAEGEAATLRQGGDEAGSALPEIPQHTVTLFTPPVQAGPDGNANIDLDLPDFNGQVRLMAVAWQGTKIGAASIDMIVRDALIAEPLLPRFLAPGDEARMGILMQNVDLAAGPATVKITLDGPLAIDGDPTLTATLEQGAQVVRTATLRATGAGRGVIHLAVTGPGGFAIQRETAILIRPSRPPVTLASGGQLAPGVELRIVPALDRMIPGTGRASVGAGGAVRYSVQALVRALEDYPLFCLEQGTSKGFPLAVLPRTEARAAELQEDLATVLDKQRFDGGFGLWSANGEAETWLSAYATEFLLRARAAGAPVPDVAIASALRFLGDGYSNLSDDDAGRAAAAYYLYDLAFGGQPRAGANRILAETLDSLPTPLAKAQLAAALALANDRPRAEAAFTAALADSQRKDWDADRGSALRDQFAIATLLKESALLPTALQTLIGRLPGADLKPDLLNTQEEAWGATAGAVLGRDDRPTAVAFDGKPVPPAPLIQVALTGPATLRNLGERLVWQTVSTTGVPIDPLPAARTGMRVTRKFLTLTGAPLDLDQLKQNTVFVLLIEGRADDGLDHRALVIQGLPAGWEIAGRLEAGKTAGMPWLGELTKTEAEPALDDRFAATMVLTADAASFRIAVRIRAVTPGTFELPGAALSDMYRPAVFARQNTGKIKIFAAE